MQKGAGGSTQGVRKDVHDADSGRAGMRLTSARVLYVYKNVWVCVHVRVEALS